VSSGSSRSPALAGGETQEAAGSRRLRGRQRRERRFSWRIGATNLALQLSVLFVVVGAWELLTATGAIHSILVPRPSEIAVALWQDVIEIFTGGAMLEHFNTTLLEVVVGFVASVVLGVGIGALLSEFQLVRRALYPYILGANAIPRIAFAPLFIIWFGFDLTPKVAMVITISTFPVLVNTMAGLSATDRDTLKLMRSLGTTRWQLFWKVRMPYALPYLFAGLETAIIFASVGAIVAEFTGGSRGLGFVTLAAQELFRLPEAFSAITLIAVQAIVLHRLIVIAGRKVIFWQADEAKAPA
jgi:NitT/TauT family transport system permease protein